MQLSIASNAILNQISDLIHQVKDEDFCRPVKTLSNSTIGQHLRHILEFFICLEQGSERGRVNYDKRQHDKLIETDRFLALHTIQKIKEFVSAQQADQPLQLEVGYHQDTEETVVIASNFYRELIYNIEHAVHHMAIMKIGVLEVAPYVSMPPDFGVAVSTIRHKKSETALQQR
ncbi:MAG: DinB family protein [Cyclobacteriaceae bacterium]|jgi:hypothetical protein